MKDPERSKRIKTIERRIKPLIQALKQKGIETGGSCQGHFGYDEPREVTEKAYVEFICPEEVFLRIKLIILNGLGRRRKLWLSFDNGAREESELICGFVYIFPPEDRSFQQQRKAVDGVIKKITKLVQEKYPPT